MLADDFCSLYFAERLGLVRSIWYWYLNWSGRYTAFAMDWLVLKFALGPYKLHYVVPVTILLWLILVTAVLYLYFREKDMHTFLHSFAVAGMFLLIVLILSPSIPQSLFWWNGMRSYTLPLVVLTFYVLMFQIRNQNPKMNLAIVCSLGFILFFMSGGMSETFAVAQTAFLLFLIGLKVLNWSNIPRTEWTILVFGLAGSICSTIVVILAPGNAIRQALLPPPPDLMKLLSISTQAYATFIYEFFVAPEKIIGLTAAIVSTLWIGGHYKDYAPANTRLIPVHILGSIAVSFACFPPGVYGYSEPPPARAMIVPVFFLTGFILYASFITGCWFASRYGSQWTSNNALILLPVLLIGFSSTAATRTLFKERQVYINFAEKWDQVDSQIMQAKAQNLEFVNIPAMSNWAGLDRPNDNRNHSPTLCYSLYYDIQIFGPPYP
jgi:hypothetical protein